MKNTFNTTRKSILVLVAASFIGSCTSNKAKPKESDHHHEDEEHIELSQAQFDRAIIKTGTVEKRSMGSSLKVSGTIEVPPRGDVSISIPYGGFITQMNVLPGTPVKKGQLLVVIENLDFIDFQKEYLECLAKQVFLKSEYDRQKKLSKEKVASGKELQEAKSLFLINKACLKAAEERLKAIGFDIHDIKKGTISSKVNFYSPINGSVREVHSNIGKFVNPKDVIMDLTNSEDLHVELTVYEKDLAKIKTGQRIQFTTTGSQDGWREAEVFLAGSSIREDRSATIHGHLKEEYKDLIPGMYVMAKIETNRHEVQSVPDRSIVRFEGKHYIFSKEAEEKENGMLMHRFQMIEINKGPSENGYTEVSLTEPSRQIEDIKLVTEGALTLLATAKNTEEEGGHGHAH